MRLAPVVVAVALATVLAACGGTDAREARTQARESAAAQEAGAPPEGSTTVPEALRGFRCEAGEDGEWFATGEVRNTTDHTLDYRVSVQVGKAGDDVAASVVDVPAVAADASERFTFDALPASGGEGPCRVQVVAIAPED